LVLDAEMQGCLPLLESFRNLGFHVTAGSYKRINMGFCSRYVHRRVVYASPALHPEAFAQRILELAKLNHYEFILPVDDFSTGILSEHKSSFLPYTKIPVVPYETFMVARDKSKTIKTALQCDIPCPSTFFPDDDAIADIARKVPYPALVKPNIGSGARGITLVGRAEELEGTYLDIKARYGECHIQEYVPKGGSQYKADLFLDNDRNLKAGIVYRKLRYFPINGGSSVVSRTVHKPEIIEYGHRLLREMDWCGFADFDFITDPRDGMAKLMEINPRIPNTFRIGVVAGIDFPSMIVKLIRGEEIPAKKEYDLDTYIRYFALDMLWFLKSPDRFRADPSVFSFLGKKVHDQIISLRDPGPIVGFCLENLLALLDRGARKSRFRRGW
jgi:predicted ATP-grasp superfamily ATP-dependent carboligase